MTRFIHIPITLAVLGLASCAGQNERVDLAPPPDVYETYWPVAANAEIRMFEDAEPEDFVPVIDEYRTSFSSQQFSGPLDILALSGGGQDGAFGAGVLTGWSESGTRPEFDHVTGISTGAVLAPFAFLGSDYDDEIERFYTETQTRDIAIFNPLAALFGRGYVAQTDPLKEKIAEELTDEMIRLIGEERAKGRSLLIGTTNIDAERPVLWDIGMIAQIGTPEAYDLVRDVILASASVPVAFEPVMIPVTNGRDTKQEMHVDGALTREIFVYPLQVPVGNILRQLGLTDPKNTIWLIHNKSLDSNYSAQNTNTYAVAARSYEMLIRSQSIGNIQNIVALAKRDGLRVNLQSILADFDAKPEAVFDQDYMTSLFEYGRAKGADPASWWSDIQRLYE